MNETQADTDFRSNEVWRYRTAAVVLLALMAGIAGLTVAMYNQSFTETSTVTVRADRAGLQMRKGTIVKLRGVDVGRTGQTTINDDGTVDVELNLKPDTLDDIPSNATVSLEQLTAFGNKHVALGLPARPATTHLRAGDVIDARHVSVEVNTVLDRLYDVLAVLEPAKVNSMLGAISSALNGQGENLGETIEILNAYLGKINRDLPTLGRDFAKGAGVLDTYADSAPDLMSMLDNGSVTADSIVSKKDQLRYFLDELNAVSTRGSEFLARNSEPLIDLLASSLPTTDLLERYSSEFSCFLKGMDKANQLVEKNFGTRVPGAIAIISVMQAGNEAYRNPANLPVMAANDGPNCHDMPAYDGSYYPRSLMAPVDRGGEPNPPGPDEDQVSLSDEPLAVQLFGPLALLGGQQ